MAKAAVTFSPVSPQQQPEICNDNTVAGRFGRRSPEFVAVVLAATVGTRLFPLTSGDGIDGVDVAASAASPSADPGESSYLPKHMLPVAGYPILYRLLNCLQVSGFREAVLAVAPQDRATVPALRRLLQQRARKQPPRPGSQPNVEEQEGDTTFVVTGSTSGGGGSTDSRHELIWWGEEEPPSTTASRAKSGAAAKVPRTSTMKVIAVRLRPPAEKCPSSTVGGGGSPSSLWECPGSMEAVRQIETAGAIGRDSHVLVVPGDLVVLNATQALADLVDLHRRRQRSDDRRCRSSAAALTMLLSDVGEVDEHGVPLKESAKQKKGGLAREDGEIEYVALSYPPSSRGSNDGGVFETNGAASAGPQVIWKQSKIDAEEDEDMVGTSPKLILAKHRLRGGRTVRVGTSWSDLHAYCLSPWVRRLIAWRESLISLQGDLVPLLISRQFRGGGILPAFGSRLLKQQEQQQQQQQQAPNSDEESTRTSGEEDDKKKTGKKQELLDDLRRLDDAACYGLRRGDTNGDQSHMGDNTGFCNNHRVSDTLPTASSSSFCEYAVLAHVVDKSAALRANSITSYLYASRELVARAIGSTPSATSSADPSLELPPGAVVHGKFHSMQLPGGTAATGGDVKKLNVKSSVVGRNCQLGNKCRLNNTVVHDDCSVGDNTVLQNCCLGRGCRVGANCNLNDCQVAAGRIIPDGTKEKGEAFLNDNNAIG